MPIRLYISQANQEHNAGPDGYREREGMDAISKKLAAVFAKDKRFRVYRNAASGVDTAAANCDEANRLGVDYYLALHSNAGMQGTVVFYHSQSPKGKRLAVALQNAIAPISPGKETGTRIKTMDGFIEIHRPNAPAVLIELEAHDWKTGTSWLTGERPAIATALYKGFCRGVQLAPRNSSKLKLTRTELTDKNVTVPRQKKPRRAGWWNFGLVPYIDRVRKQGDGDRVQAGNRDPLIIPVPETRPAWWRKVMLWKKANR